MAKERVPGSAKYTPVGKEGGPFTAIRVTLASPDVIRAWSRGEVKKPETINYRTFKPERDGLFCERIFGPVKSWECSCGKYKKLKHKDIICDRCGVEVVDSKVRRERMGHIELAAPVAHIWYVKGVPSRMAALLGISSRDLEKVIYYEQFIVLDPGKTGLKRLQLLSEAEYRKVQQDPHGRTLKARIGAEAIRDLLRELDLAALSKVVRKDFEESGSVQRKKELSKQLRVVEAFRRSGNHPDWMVLESLPVLPPDLRPLVPLDGGRFATSDLNDLYRRVINRNNRLRRLMEIKAPEIIIQNEKRMLQESVDALFDNGRGGHVVKGAGNRPFKSLSDMLKGKQGRFRQNLLGKRVDYSGRSVIVVGPDLRLHECGLPKEMALELFKPFIIRKLEERGYVHTIKSAKKLVERSSPEVWDVLEEVIEEHPVLLNRAPTLHRLGIQAFQPILVEGKAIKINPLVCSAFNADFDGDQMAVHVPLSVEAQLEARILMMSTNNILSPSNGRPILSATQDTVLGVYYLTGVRKGVTGEGKTFPNLDEVERAYQGGWVNLHARIKVRHAGKTIDTTVGLVIFNITLPEEVRFKEVEDHQGSRRNLTNRQMGKKELTELVAVCYREYGSALTIRLLDSVKRIGFEFATVGGITVSLEDMKVPGEKSKVVEKTREEVRQINLQYQKNVITDGERYNRVIDLWTQATTKVSEAMMKRLEEDKDRFNPIYMMAKSGARGKEDQVRQLAGMRGLMARPAQRITGSMGEIIEHPITSNFREGLNVLEYFISTHGARKGLADTALKTADAGYLTRRIVDVAQDVKVMEEDCGTIQGIIVSAMREGADTIEPLRERIAGRVALDPIADILTDEVIVRAGDEITDEASARIEDLGIERVRIRSVLTCESRGGVCVKCYGRDLATGRMVSIGEAVGVIAGQSIGEPGTQLTLRTFHVGGAASRVVETSRIDSRSDGTLRYGNLRILKNGAGETVVINRNAEISIFDEVGRERETHVIPYGAVLRKHNGEGVKKGDLLAVWDPYSVPIFSEMGGKTKFHDVEKDITMQEEVDKTTGRVERRIIDSKDEHRHPQIFVVDSADSPQASYTIPVGAYLQVHDGQAVKVGDIVAKLPRQTTRTGDITGGLPRVAELFEARRPRNYAIISEIDGTVRFMGLEKGSRKITVEAKSGLKREYLVPLGRHLDVRDSDTITAGEPLTDGLIDPHDILRVKGENAVQEYLLNKIQEVYRLQGVIVNDKHIEAIVRQMLRKVLVLDPGSTEFLAGQQIDRVRFKEENARVFAKGGKPATARPVLLGITKASLSTESFVSAASFQETTRVLAEAAVNGQVDKLSGLKENVIMGHLISAGTGIFREEDIVLELPKELETPLMPEVIAAQNLASMGAEPEASETVAAS
ncbi:MAG: DNA-directed RNA polymerase subunit beta' [Candidatus Coatesbacteria bacterium]